jgi:hypothetical protein
MDRCRACGASLAPGSSWCARCLTPIGRSAPAVQTIEIDERRPEAEPVERAYSRWRGGPTTFGWPGRMLTTAVLLFVAWCVYAYVFPVLLGLTNWRFFILYALVAGPVVVYLVWRLWQPARIQ